MNHATITVPGLDCLGGAERQAIVLARGLRQRGWRVTMVALSGTSGTAAMELRGAGVAFLSLEMRKGLADPRGWLRFHRWLRRERPDVVHAHLPHAAWMARWSRIAAYVPVVIDTLHSSYVGGRGRRIGYRLSRGLPDCVTAVSEATAAAHVHAGMVREDRLAVVGNGIATDMREADRGARLIVRQQLGVTHEFLWLAVGRLEPVKDFATLLHAMARGEKSARLAVLGDGTQRSALRELAVRLGLHKRVQFPGFQEDVTRWMQAADGFVLSSRYEGLPMVVLEAGACGLPTVATDVPGTREAVVNGETGLLAEAGDADALCAAMARVMRMPVETRRMMGQRAQQWVETRFGLEAVLDQWERLYAELLERSKVRRVSPLMAWESLKRRSAHSA